MSWESSPEKQELTIHTDTTVKMNIFMCARTMVLDCLKGPADHFESSQLKFPSEEAYWAEHEKWYRRICDLIGV